MSWFDEIARWYLVSLAAGLCVAPFTAWLFRRLPGYGAFFARPVGLLAVVWPVWFLASISPFPYRDLTLIVSAIAIAALCWGLAFRARFVDRTWLRPHLAAEGVFLVAFLGYLWFRGYTPIITGTEKPMDSAFLAATIRATDMPPPDPWMAGETINYYYLGFLLNGSVARIAELPGWVAYNLALATVFAISVTAAAGLAWGVVRLWLAQRLAIMAGAASAFLVMIAGNMRAPIRVIEDPDLAWNAFWFAGLGWESSRVIYDIGSQQEQTITEFPSFSFVLGDLHPHVLALPFTIVALALATSLFLRKREVSDRNDVQSWAELAAIGVIIGSLYPMNSWDFPTYLGAVAIAILICVGLSRKFVEQVGVITVAAVIAWLPFWVGFVPFAGGSTENTTSIPGLRFVQETVATYTGERTSAGEYLTVWGITWSIAMVYLVVETVATWTPRAEEAEREPIPSHLRGAVLAAVVVVAVIALALPAPVIVLAGIPLALAVRLVVRDLDLGNRGVRVLVCTLYAAGWAITILTEFFYIRDVFNGRFNTLFKVYYQVWTLVGVASAIAIVLLWRRAADEAPKRALLGAGIAAVVSLGLVYPVYSMKTWIDYLNPGSNWAGLDGLSGHGEGPYLIDPSNADRNTGDSVDDVAAIRWLQENARPGDVILEAPGCGYQLNGGIPTSRFSGFTGVPTVIGWNGHEGQWRGGQPELQNQIVPRAGDVSSMFEDPDPSTNPLFDQYGITLMVIGDFEKFGAGVGSEGPNCDIAGPYQSIGVEGYPGPGWELVYDGTTKIYRRAGI